MATAITINKSFTRNLGNFESTRVEYGLTSDDIRDGESLDEFRARLKAKVEKWVVEDVEEIDADAR